MAKSSASRLVQISGSSTSREQTNKIPKSEALYVHFPGEEYDCDECVFWFSDNKCLIHRSSFVVREEDSCGFMIEGAPDTFYGRPHLNMDPKTTGFVRNIEGGGCRQCKFYENRDCHRVDKHSPGDDPGEIHPDACCALQEAVKRG